MLLLALLVASGPVIVDGRDPPKPVAAVAGAVLGGVGGAAVGAGIAIVAGVVVEQRSVCHQVGAHCTDDMDGLMAMLRVAMIAVPASALVGAAVGGVMMEQAVANEPQTRVVEHAY